MAKSVVVIGPYVGDLEQELFTFRPYAKYITSIMNMEDVYISSHFNRRFMYDWVPEGNFIPIFESLTRDETKQCGYLHEDISRSDYTQLVKYLKGIIKDLNGKVEMEVFSPPYIKSTNTISIYQKEFSSLVFPNIDISNDDYIAFISDKSEQSKDIYNKIRELYNVIVIGNMSNGIEWDNTVLKSPDYYTNGYIHMMNYINKSKLFITNCPVWGLVGNILGKHMIYWGNCCSQFKTSGVYGFDNENVISVDIDADQVVSMIEYKYKGIR